MIIIKRFNIYQHLKVSTLFILAIILLCLPACKQQGHAANGNINSQPHTAAEPKYNAGLHLAVGAKYYYDISNITTTAFDAQGKEMENVKDVKAGLIYEVVKDTAGGFVIKMTYDRFKVQLKDADGDKEMDTDNGINTLDPVEKMLGLLKGSHLFVTLDKKGHVTAVNGYKELTDKIMSGVVTQNGVDKQKMRDQLLNTFGEGFVKNNMEQGFSVLPDTAVYVGDSWTSKREQISEIKMDVATKYTVQSIENNVAEIDAVADIKDNDSSVNLMGYNVAVDLEGSQDGNYKTDTNTGMLISGSSDISIKGTVQIQFKDVPLNIKTKNRIVVKKI